MFECIAEYESKIQDMDLNWCSDFIDELIAFLEGYRNFKKKFKCVDKYQLVSQCFQRKIGMLIHKNLIQFKHIQSKNDPVVEEKHHTHSYQLQQL